MFVELAHALFHPRHCCHLLRAHLLHTGNHGQLAADGPERRRIYVTPRVLVTPRVDVAVVLLVLLHLSGCVMHVPSNNGCCLIPICFYFSWFLVVQLWILARQKAFLEFSVNCAGFAMTWLELCGVHRAYISGGSTEWNCARTNSRRYQLLRTSSALLRQKVQNWDCVFAVTKGVKHTVYCGVVCWNKKNQDFLFLYFGFQLNPIFCLWASLHLSEKFSRFRQMESWNAHCRWPVFHEISEHSEISCMKYRNYSAKRN